MENASHSAVQQNNTPKPSPNYHFSSAEVQMHLQRLNLTMSTLDAKNLTSDAGIFFGCFRYYGLKDLQHLSREDINVLRTTTFYRSKRVPWSNQLTAARIVFEDNPSLRNSQGYNNLLTALQQTNQAIPTGHTSPTKAATAEAPPTPRAPKTTRSQLSQALPPPKRPRQTRRPSNESAPPPIAPPPLDPEIASRNNAFFESLDPKNAIFSIPSATTHPTQNMTLSPANDASPPSAAPRDLESLLFHGPFTVSPPPASSLPSSSPPRAKSFRGSSR